MLEGVHLIDVYRRRIGAPETVVVLDEVLARSDVAELVAYVPPSRMLVVSRTLFAELATLPADVAMLAVVPTPMPANTSPGRFCLLLEDVQDPGNVGTMIRTAAAAGADQVVLSPHCAFAWSPRSLRAGQGAHFLTAVNEGVDLREWVAAFRHAGGRTFATVVAGTAPLYRVDLRGRVAIVIGSEGSGVTRALLDVVDERITIPMAAGSESLNAAAAAAVVLFEAVRQRGQGCSHYVR